MELNSEMSLDQMELSGRLEKQSNTDRHMSISLGIGPKSVICRFNKMVLEHGGFVKVVEELLARQSKRTTKYSFQELTKGSAEEWIVNITENDEAPMVEIVLQDLDVYVTKNRLKDRSSGVEDLLFGDLDDYTPNVNILQDPVSIPFLAEEMDSTLMPVTEKDLKKGDNYPSADPSIHTSSVTEDAETEYPARDKNAEQTAKHNVLVLLELDDGAFCSFCGGSFVSNLALNHHIRKTHSEEISQHNIPYYYGIQCPLCDELHESRNALQEHCRRDHLRHLTFTSDGDFKLNPNELSKCPKCDYVALRKGRMSTHLKESHSIVEEITCDVCGKTFSSHRAMQHHFNQFHTMINVPCDVCGKMCKNRSSYQSHSLTHTRVFKCQYCGKQFNDRRCYIQHEKRHLSKTIHLCPHCGQHFTLKSNLDRHIKITHLKEGKLTCDSCTFSTFYKDYLKEHINKVHFGIKKSKFTCHHCQKDFSRRVIYEEHMDKHNGTYRYTCQCCGKKYRNKARCKQHTLQCQIDSKIDCETEVELSKGNANIENSSLIVDGDVVETPLPDPGNLGLIVTMEFVEGTDDD